jgi:very-short-patch-repair endonuclease
MTRAWSAKEEEVLIRLYPVEPRQEVLKALPGRNWKAIGIKAARLGISRSKDAAYDLETKRRIREAAIERYREHPELRKLHSEKTKLLYQRGILKSPLAKMGNGQEPTPYEELASLFLEPLGFQRELPVPPEEIGPPYKLDFGHPILKINVEIDGKQHRETRIQERDHKRDEHLRELGWRVIRISNKAISSLLIKILSKRLPR